MERETKEVFKFTRTFAMVGVEAEFFILNGKGEAIVVPPHLPRDGFPILGEVRGDPGENVAETVANFWKEYYSVQSRIRDTHIMAMKNIMKIRLKRYQEAMRQMDQPKNEHIGDTRNIYGVDIDEFSDQVLKAGKIQGINASCGLHIHFSLVSRSTAETRSQKLESVDLPINTRFYGDDDDIPQVRFLEETFRPSVRLYRLISDESEDKKISATANLLTRPAAEWIVKQMDDAFFNKFAPPKEERTKFRQAGFYRRKDYGIEYRSLPANAQTMEALTDIIKKAFKLLDELKKDI